MKKDTIIFDLDGTLLNTLNDLHACINQTINHFGYASRSLEEIKSFVGNGIKQAIKLSLPNDVKEKDLNKIVEYFRYYYAEHMFDLTKPYDGILDLLKILKEKGYKLGVVSNKYDLAVKHLVKNYFGEFVTIAVGESDKIRKKPEKDGIIKAIKELHSEINSAIFVGDSDVDIKTSQNADIPCISVLWGYRDKEFLIKNGGKIYAEKPNDIIEIIEKKLYLI